MKKVLKDISCIGAVSSIGIGTTLLIKGMQGKGILWCSISGAILIISGIQNLVFIGVGMFDAAEILLHRIAKGLERRF